MNTMRMRDTVRRALDEDLGRGDITTEALIPAGVVTRAEIISRSHGVLAGMEAASNAYKMLDPDVVVEPLVPEGGRLKPGDRLALITGDTRAVLTAERVALNFLQRLSGIASVTAKVVDAVKDLPVKIVDTRKTTPGLRMLEKYAVSVGGGFNHRFGLDDAVLIKENHLRAAGGVLKAVETVRRRVGPLVKIEVETENLDEVSQALSAGADIIMLDNMDPETMKEAVSLVGRRALVEASGNITPANVVEAAAAGVDFISLGWLTHSAPPLDLTQLLVA